MAGLHNVEFVMSQRGKPQVLFDGYLHTKNVERLTCVHWKCVKSTCRGRLTTVGTVMRNATEHNHAPYIVTTWVDHGARFPLPPWNHHGTTGPRTNNNLEGFHNRLIRHPDIYRFVEVVRKVEQAERAKILQLDFGAAPRGRKRVSREVENRLCRLKDELNREVKSPM
ncbi:uncharacterized protein [Haliotis cracherodii]|uniref:uncharacterized protein n=1 Tax=Haliotis cracherodii TaxID=6455 RepID=UPI0039EBA77C